MVPPLGGPSPAQCFQHPRDGQSRCHVSPQRPAQSTPQLLRAGREAVSSSSKVDRGPQAALRQHDGREARPTKPPLTAQCRVVATPMVQALAVPPLGWPSHTQSNRHSPTRRTRGMESPHRFAHATPQPLGAGREAASNSGKVDPRPRMLLCFTDAHALRSTPVQTGHSSTCIGRSGRSNLEPTSAPTTPARTSRSPSRAKFTPYFCEESTPAPSLVQEVCGIDVDASGKQ